jgi:hypothetical protein
MRAIITYPNPDGTYDEIGTNNRHVSKSYKTLGALLKYNVRPGLKARFEIYLTENFYKQPDKVIYK